MSGEGYRVLLQARSWSKALRDKRFTWEQIADVLALTHPVSPLRLYRLAHGRTAADVVAVINDADPAGTAAMRESRLYDFESWPEAGRRPQARLLAALAEIYQTSARNLLSSAGLAAYGAEDRALIDRADFRDTDANRPPSPDRMSRVTMETSAGATPADRSLVDVPACVRLLRSIGVEETDVRRRELLFELALVLGGSKALELLRVLTPEEGERLAGVLRNTWRVDEAAVRTFEKLTMHARLADDLTGPATLLPVVNEHRSAIGRVLARESMPSDLRERLLHTYVQMSQLAGFLAYDMRDNAAAERPLRDGLQAALDLGDPTLIGYLHYWLGRVAVDQDRMTTALDHAFAVQSWAARSPSRLLAPLHGSLSAIVHAAEGDAAASIRAHDRALAAAGAEPDGEPAFLSCISPATLEIGRDALQIRLKRPAPVMAAAERLLAGLDPQYKRRHGLVLTRYASALAMAREIPEAVAKLTEAAGISRQHSSARLTDEIAQARTRMNPWADTTYVRRLDETLRSCGLR
ncbi:hypothetical protein [Nonomuraea sp. NPDC002799]